MKSIRTTVAFTTISALLLLAGSNIANADPMDLDVFTTFEEITPNTLPNEPFTIGTSPASAEFSGNAFAGVGGVPELYFSGIRAWMVMPDSTGLIQFETNAATVEFWSRIRTGADGATVITAFGDNGTAIDSVTIDTPGPFQLVSFTGDIDHITVRNNATGTEMMNTIDDFGFTPIPEPAAFVGLVLCTALALRKTR